MKIVISAPTGSEGRQSEETLERLLRIAFTRYVSLVRQVTLDLDAKTVVDASSSHRVHIRVCVKHWPDVEVEEVQPQVGLAIDRAIHRADGMLRQYARREARRA